MKHKILAMALLCSSGIAAADEYGPFLCNSGCLLLGPTPDGETQMFIQQVANQYDDGHYKLGDTVEVCNGSACATYARAFASFVLRSRGPDNGGPYVNQPAGGGGGSNGGSGSGGGSGGGGGLQPVYVAATVCAGGQCHTEWIVVGYQWV